MLKFLKRFWFGAPRKAPERPARVTVPPPRRAQVPWRVLIDRLAARTAKAETSRAEFKTYAPAPGVLPAGVREQVLAADATPYDFLNEAFPTWTQALQAGFVGYPYLSQLAQLPEYQKITNTIAKEMTRKWIKLTATGDSDKTDKLTILEQELDRHKVRNAFRVMAQHDGFFGRGQLYIDVRKPGGAPARSDDLELRTPLVRAPAKITKGSLIGFRPVEPVWMYPGNYNSVDPLAPDFYKPQLWYVMGRTVHASRFIFMLSRPVPDLLKAAYSFGGLSLSQLSQPYVDHWLRTRNAVSDVIHSFSTSGLKTDLSQLLTPLTPGGTTADSGNILDRVEAFAKFRDNRNMLVLDSEREDFFQFNVPLSGLHELQAQSQEQMASVSSIPLVKLLGITPNGMNATSDGEIRVFYDDIHAHQENTFREPLKVVLELIQLDRFGVIDPDIGFEFVPLFQLSSLEEANERKVNADTDAALIEASIISPDEARDRVRNDKTGPYQGLEGGAPQEEDDTDEELGDRPAEGEEAARADSTGAGTAKDQAQRRRPGVVPAAT